MSTHETTPTTGAPTTAAEQHAARIERTSEEVVDTVLRYVGQGVGGPHIAVQGLLERLVADETDGLLKRVRDALEYEDPELGWSQAVALVDDLLKEQT